MGRSEALAIFREWFSTRALLRCQLDFRGVAAGLRGRILELSDDSLRLFTDEMSGEVAVLFREDLKVDFGSGVAPPSSEHGRGVVITFSLPEEGFADSIAFFEIKDL